MGELLEKLFGEVKELEAELGRVCEWTEEPNGIARAACGNHLAKQADLINYCPYCGRKVKVNEKLICQECGGCGATETPIQVCCNRPTPSGECCGNPDMDIDLDPCHVCGGSGEIRPEEEE